MKAKVDFYQRLRERAAVIASTVISQQDFYKSAKCTDNQRQLLETMVGAALWYLPQSDDLWTKCISVSAVRAFVSCDKPSSVKLTKDHHYPRKVSAAELFALDWSAIEDSTEEVFNRYLDKYGQYNLVLPLENKQLVKYQRTNSFLSPGQSYDQAGIELVSIGLDQLKSLKKGDKVLAENLLARVD